MRLAQQLEGRVKSRAHRLVAWVKRIVSTLAILVAPGRQQPGYLGAKGAIAAHID